MIKEQLEKEVLEIFEEHLICFRYGLKGECSIADDLRDLMKRYEDGLGE